MLRRTFLASAAGVACSGLGPAWAQAADDGYEDAVLDSVLNELEILQGSPLERTAVTTTMRPDRSVVRRYSYSADLAVPPLSADTIATLRAQAYWNVLPADRPSPSWPVDAAAPDYEHLSDFGNVAPGFTLTAGVLKTLATRNAFKLNWRRPVTIFGLRGCRIADGADAKPWSTSHNLETLAPNHLQARCIIGVWRQSDDQLALFQASTVPAVAHIYASLAEQGFGTSLLPTGLYSYSAGSHRADKPDRIQRGALLLSGDQVVLRTAKELSFDALAETTAWTRGNVHNIHSAGKPDRYDSAGCQVVPGGYAGPDRKKATGRWSDFRVAAGLVDADGAPIAPEAKPTFQYMLLTGREAALAYQGGQAFAKDYFRLRPGSTGGAVKKLQEKLLAASANAVPGLTADGGFGTRTAFAVLLGKGRDTGAFTSPVATIGSAG